MRLIAYYHMTLGLLFYSLGILALYEGARSGFYHKIINTDVIITILGLIIALFSMIWGIIQFKMGVTDLKEGEGEA
jgi:hypothetical protein